MRRGLYLLLLMHLVAILRVNGENAKCPVDLRVGNVSFTSPSTSNHQALQSFKTGLALLHDFWYDLARVCFREAQDNDKHFGMAYWGELMTFKDILWNTQDYQSAIQLIEQLDKVPVTFTGKEILFWEAARQLFSSVKDTPGSEIHHFTLKFKEIHEKFPIDAEATCFYALGLLANSTFNTESNQSDIATAKELLKSVLQVQPQHPGALHYWIHAHDVPNVTIVSEAREHALSYAKVAPDSAHAVHMITHVFVNTGEWGLLIDYNKQALQVSDKYCGLKNVECNAENRYHALEWVHYGLLQLGLVDESASYLQRMEVLCCINFLIQQEMHQRYPKSMKFALWYSRMRSRQIWDSSVDSTAFMIPVYPQSTKDDYWASFTQSSDLVTKLLTEQILPLSQSAISNSETSVDKSADVFSDTSNNPNSKESFDMKSSPVANEGISQFTRILSYKILEKQTYIASLVKIDQLMYNALLELFNDEYSQAIKFLDEAILISESNPRDASSPTLPVIPIHEFYAKFTRNSSKAEQLYTKSIEMWAPRRSSVQGLVKSLIKQGKDKEAAKITEMYPFSAEQGNEKTCRVCKHVAFA